VPAEIDQNAAVESHSATLQVMGTPASCLSRIPEVPAFKIKHADTVPRLPSASQASSPQIGMESCLFEILVVRLERFDEQLSPLSDPRVLRSLDAGTDTHRLGNRVDRGLESGGPSVVYKAAVRPAHRGRRAAA